MSTVSGPITGGRGWPFGAPTTDLSAVGYRSDEYFLGEAVRYGPTAGSELGRDGRWKVEPVESAPYKTRLVVVRPVDPAACNGTVIVLWNNVSAGYENFGGGDTPEVFENGYAYVAASVQRVGVHGQPDNPQGLRDWDPERYGTLSIPSDDYSYDIYTQVADVVAPDRSGSELDPMGGLDVQRLIAQGASQSAARLASYLNGVQPITRRFDAFFLVMYFGGGTPLEVGDAVMTVRQPAAGAAQTRIPEGLHLLRDDLGIRSWWSTPSARRRPVFRFASPTPVLGGGRRLARLAACHGLVVAPYGAGLRLLHPAGRVHAGHQSGLARAGGRRRPASPAGLADRRRSPAGPTTYQLRRRSGGDRARRRRHCPRGHPASHGRGAPGPQQRPPAIARCLRPARRLPRAPTDDRVRELYGSRDVYLARYEEAARAAEGAAVILPRDVDPFLTEAENAFPL